MPRRKNDPQGTPLDQLRIDIGVHGTSHSAHEGTYIDPLKSLPGGILPAESPKYVKDQRVRARPGERAAGRDIYKVYLSNLLRVKGDVTHALVLTLHVTEEEAAERGHELHAEILSNAGGSQAITEVLKRYDLSREARLMVLRDHLYSDNAPASLKAIDLLNDMDSGTAGDAGSYESYLRIALANRTGK